MNDFCHENKKATKAQIDSCIRGFYSQELLLFRISYGMCQDYFLVCT